MVMTLRASATTTPPLPSPPSSLPLPPRTFSLSKTTPKSQFRPTSLSLPTSTTLSLYAFFTTPYQAKALELPKDQIVSSLTQVESTIDQVQEVGSNLFDVAQRVFQVVAETVKPGIDVAFPILRQAGEQAVKIASPAVSEASKKAQEAIQSSGFDTEPVLTAAKTVAGAAQKTTKIIEDVKPIASSTVETISSADPIVIVGTAGALFLTYLLFPPIWSAVSFSLRGFKGELTPAQTLDLMSTKNHLMIDIRSEKEKDKAGIPRLPSGAKNKMIAIPLEELPSKLRSLVRNVKKVEAELLALKISYLKKINKGSNIVIMDSYSDSAKLVARALTSLGFKNCWIVADGFSGSRGWIQSRLGIDSYKFAFAEVISPSQVIPAAVRRFGTTGSAKFLPGSSD
ncbi:calcium sensing receptor, chloroplastic [Cornus florida]|uniref:calcium sensing receptor, chloroplastic n=1 Tax=Cornus florida TaxID=4283 RepID=UPI0028A10DFB|nr:calcium sensing receptor, chloroplastic [Cornus florida]